jgi:two-component system chemotaxis response regulator CheY
VRFATVGTHDVKCMEPRALFHLPMVSIAGCTSADMIEDRIRAAWAAHGVTVRETAARLRKLGIPVETEADGALVAFPLGGFEPAAARARLSRLDRIVLPGAGPLDEVRLGRAAERLIAGPAGLDSASELEIAVTNRMEILAREAQRAAERRRTSRALAATPEERLSPLFRLDRHRLLVVGPQLVRDEPLIRKLRRAGYDPERARTPSEALAAFRQHSFDLVIAETDLGRSEGIELIPAFRQVPGVADLPVVLVDDRMRPSRREAARRIGAAGYLVRPIQPEAIARGLGRVARGARGRRYGRFASGLAVRCQSAGEVAFTTTVSRMGMFVRTPWNCPPEVCQAFEISLPDGGEGLQVEAQTLYRVDEASPQGPGLGLRFRGFAKGDEARWIEYLGSLRGSTPLSSAGA